MFDFQYYFTQREAIETVVYLHDVVGVKDKFDRTFHPPQPPKVPPQFFGHFFKGR
jgi:hypothetical protein